VLSVWMWALQGLLAEDLSLPKNDSDLKSMPSSKSRTRALRLSLLSGF
jgi:hypothetical protein